MAVEIPPPPPRAFSSCACPACTRNATPDHDLCGGCFRMGCELENPRCLGRGTCSCASCIRKAARGATRCSLCSRAGCADSLCFAPPETAKPVARRPIAPRLRCELPVEQVMTETITSAARRLGRPTSAVTAALLAAGVHTPPAAHVGRGGCRYAPADIDAAVLAYDLARPSRTTPTPPPVEEPTPAAPSVECVTCLSWRECTGNRRARCRWCRDGAPPWDGERKSVATRRYTRRPAS